MKEPSIEYTWGFEREILIIMNDIGLLQTPHGAAVFCISPDQRFIQRSMGYTLRSTLLFTTCGSPAFLKNNWILQKTNLRII